MNGNEIGCDILFYGISYEIGCDILFTVFPDELLEDETAKALDGLRAEPRTALVEA